MRVTIPRVAATALAALFITCARRPSAPPLPSGARSWCETIPHPGNAAFERVPNLSAWFDVHRVAEGVFAITEPRQWQQVISYLIVGSESALLFDTGLGMIPIRPVVERLTALPISVLNSHTHYDHVGGNFEFDRILALDTPYTRANQGGFGHDELVSEVADESFCGAAGEMVDRAAFRTNPWRASRIVEDGDTVDLGGRVLTILHVPGHTPDAVALLDAEQGLLFTGDSYYEGPIWLYVPETDLDAYSTSMMRLSSLGETVKQLLPAHVTVSADPGRIAQAIDALRRVRAGEVAFEARGENRVMFRFEGFSILTSTPLLEGRRGDPTRGGSGLTVWN